MPEPTLSAREQERYQRQMLLPGWGAQAQQKLKQARVFIAGAGGLGSPVSIYLAVAGVGTLRICDCGAPELSNLNRQILHDDSRIGMNKAASARQTLERLNPDIRVEALPDQITEQSAGRLVGDADLIIDCLDNFETRHVLNRHAVRNRIPLIHAGVYGMQGQITFISPPETPCLWCIHPGTQPRTLFPIVGATAGIIGCLQALEAIKHLSGIGTTLRHVMLFWDGGKMEFNHVPHRRDPRCPVCGEEREG